MRDCPQWDRAEVAAGTTSHERRFTPPGKDVLTALNTVVSLAIFTLLFAAIYKVMPDTTLYWRHLLLGAFVTAVLFTRETIDRVVRGSSGPSSSSGAAGALIVLMLWVYYFAQILRTDIFVRRRTDEDDR